MKMELSETQVVFLERKLETLGLEYEPLQDELLDHVCCMAEEIMQKGNTFEEATKTIFEIFGKDELNELQNQTISFTQKKSHHMKKIAITLLTLLIILSSIFFFGKKENMNTRNAIQPPSPQEMMTFENLIDEKIEIAEAVFIHTPDDPPSIKPIDAKTKITSGFGQRMHPVHKKKVLHKGIDFRAPIGTPVLATSDGIVKKAELGRKHGKFILLQHDKEFKTKYSHLSEIKVKVGQEIKKGDVIGLVGSTGMSTAPHLHYEVIKNGKCVNPIDYFKP